VSFVLSAANSGTSGSSCGCHLIQTTQLQLDLDVCLLFNPSSSSSFSSSAAAAAAAVAARSILALHLIAHAVVEEEDEVNEMMHADGACERSTEELEIFNGKAVVFRQEGL
jgi:hypothetical protein